MLTNLRSKLRNPLINSLSRCIWKKVEMYPPVKPGEDTIPNAFTPGPDHEAYIKYDEEAVEHFEKKYVDDQVTLIEKPTPYIEVDPNQEPYRAIFENNPDMGTFTKAEVVADRNSQLWFWVERIIRTNQLDPKPKPLPPGQTYPTGYVPPPEVRPNLPYFIPRTRTYLLPVYRRYEIIGPRTFTVIKNIDGDIWLFENDLRGWLEAKNGTKILSAVHEQKHLLLLKEDHVIDVRNWLIEKGF